ncbi:pilus assembly protein TadG-related protein [Sandarakinorhabdus sp.]|uniref:pilus assembly protein TadG-related protein n=1 Tax=Sandarakinorhabdus sp. TaxID=1916663 RepID=UPI003F72CDEC
MSPFRQFISGKAGSIAPIFALALPVLTAGVGFAVDGASIRLAQAQLQVAADAAAAAGARKLDPGSDPTVEAQRVAGLNLPADSYGTVLAGSDVQGGTWNATTGAFTAGTSNRNAVRITTRLADANGNAHRLVFGSILGMNSIDLSASATALCPSHPSLSLISNNIPGRTAVVTMGNPCSAGSGHTGTCYWATPDGNPIVRVDNWNPGVTTITIRITSPSQHAGTFEFTAPAAGQFWVVVPNVQLNPALPGQNATNIVFRVQSSSPTVPPNRINLGGTATYNNRLNTSATLPGTALCAFGATAAASRIVR